jgi:hypothetical protein
MPELSGASPATFFRTSCQKAESCVIIQGFADANSSVKTLGFKSCLHCKNFLKQVGKAAKVVQQWRASLLAAPNGKTRQQLQKNSKIFEAGTKKRATMQGFADRSGGKQEDSSFLVFFKNIQPISVGV